MLQQLTTISPESLLAIVLMLIGSIGTIKQLSFKGLMAYSTVLHVGYALVGWILHTREGNFAALLYMIIYIVSVAALFACLLGLLGSKAWYASINNIKGIGYTKKSLSAAILIIMFSLIGVPPLAGFFGKYYIIYQSVAHEEFTLPIVVIVTTIISSYTYLKIIGLMYFSDVQAKIEYIPTNLLLLFITSSAISFILFLGLFASKILQ